MDIADRTHLEHAQGWLGLGSWLEANEALENISASLRVHPEVLAVRFEIYAKTGKWEGAYEIANVLCQIQFWENFYRFARAACQLGKLKEAFKSLEKAIDLAGAKDIRAMALDEKDLEPLWLDISEI